MGSGKEPPPPDTDPKPVVSDSAPVQYSTTQERARLERVEENASDQLLEPEDNGPGTKKPTLTGNLLG